MSQATTVWKGRWARRSIGVRLLLAVLVMVGLALPIAGALLSHHYHTSATQAFDERLAATLNVIMAGVTYDALPSNSLSMTGRLATRVSIMSTPAGTGKLPMARKIP